MFDWDAFDFETRAVRAGQQRSNEQEQGEPIFTTSSFVYETAAEAAARFSGELPGNIYSRFTNPTVRTFERRLAALEGGERCVATASGMAAILSLCLALLRAGDGIVASRSLFGSTHLLFDRYLARFGITTRYAALADLDSWREAIGPTTRLLFLESPSNPLLEVADIPALAELAHRHGALLVVDNCVMTPALQRPLALGADLVVHSATKYIDGQGRCLGGAVVGREELMEEIYSFMRTAGPTMSPFNAWVFTKGLETLSLRMRAHCESALLIARWLSEQPEVARSYYPGLADHPQHRLAVRQQSGFGGLVSFELAGGREAAWAFIDATQLLSITANLGDTKSTITHPATTTHGRLSPQDRAAAGIGDGLVRISVGLESATDLIADLERGLLACRPYLEERGDKSG